MCIRDRPEPVDDPPAPPNAAPDTPDAPDTGGSPLGESAQGANRFRFAENQQLAAALPETAENGYPRLDIGREHFPSDRALFTQDSGVLVTDTDSATRPSAAAVSRTDTNPAHPESITAETASAAESNAAITLGPTAPLEGAPEGAGGSAALPPSEPPLLRLYTVESGDTFSSIALETYGSGNKWVEIAQANPLVDPDRLKVGQEIKLPDLEGAARTAGGPAAAAEDDLPRRGATYTIKSGDNLSSIAKQFYGSVSKWELIYQANRDAIGDDPGRLKLGTKLLIPPPANGAD